MGDIIDDFLQIKKEYASLKGDFSGMAGDIKSGTGKGAKPSVVDIWDESRYYAKVGINLSLCAHTKSEEADCSYCTDICPTNALSINEHNMSIKEDQCIGCALCVPSCPTSALYSAKADPKKVYDQIAASAASGEVAYVSCARALKKTPPTGVIVLPCLGVMTRELWFSLLAAYDNIAIYLPFDACVDCVTSCGEDLYGEAISQAEVWARETVGFECEEDNLRFDKKYSAERQDFLNSVLKSTVSVAGKVNPFAAGATKAYQTIDKHRKDLSSLQATLNKFCGGESQQETPLVLEPNRQLVLNALKSYKDLAEGVEVRICETGDTCVACGACIKACPLGARVKKDGEVVTLAPYCVGCGFCESVCPQDACIVETHTAELLLSEMTDFEKKFEKLKAVAVEKADEATGKVKTFDESAETATEEK